MLILKRRQGESIRISDEIEIQIKAIEGSTVTIAIITDQKSTITPRLHGTKEGRLFVAANESRI